MIELVRKITKFWHEAIQVGCCIYKKFWGQTLIRRSLCFEIITTLSQTLRIFSVEVSICKERTWQLVRNLLYFLPQPPHMKSWYQDKIYNFQSLFGFYRILKRFGHTFGVMVREQDVSNFLPLRVYSLTLDSITWISFFDSVYSIIASTCSSNLTLLQKIRLIK